MGLYLIAAVDVWSILATIWTYMMVAIGLGFVIFVHELGHFLVAKACGVKCEKFYVGFDVPIRIGPIRFPRTFGKFTYGETEYGIGVIPLGGYVKMLGQDDNPGASEAESARIRIKREDSVTGEEVEELDPRSYPAKAVWQRMLIISAGVVMNLITGVMFAAVAYQMGVKYSPCVIAGTSPGDPAWEYGLRPGDEIIGLAKGEEPDEHLRFEWELRHRVIEAGLVGKVPAPMQVTLRRNSEILSFEITPTDRLKELNGYVSLGILQARNTKLSSPNPVSTHMAAGRPLSGEFLGGDRIVAVNGQPLPRDEETQEIFFYHIEQIMAREIDKPLTFTVERKESTDKDAPLVREDVVVPPSRLRVLGVVMDMGPVESLQIGSPAEKAGIKKGDVITAINGEPVGDPITLPQRVARLEPVETEFSVQREADGKLEELTFSIRPDGAADLSPPLGPGTRLSLPRFGLAYSVGSQAVAIAPGSPAEKAGMKVGDRVTQVKFTAPDEIRKKVVELYSSNFDKPIEFDEIDQWAFIHTQMQEVLPEMSIELTVREDTKEGKVRVLSMQPVESTDAYYFRRGLKTRPFERIHTASSVSEAVSLGLRETKEKLLHVFNVLQMLVTFKLSPRNLGGPIMIAAVAGSEASEGLPRLLLFLTFLSANLAILNFLPIPALDGGHMVFLAAEAVIGKPVNERLQVTLTVVGVICLLSLMVFVFANDIHRFFW